MPFIAHDSATKAYKHLTRRYAQAHVRHIQNFWYAFTVITQDEYGAYPLFTVPGHRKLQTSTKGLVGIQYQAALFFDNEEEVLLACVVEPLTGLIQLYANALENKKVPLWLAEKLQYRLQTVLRDGKASF